MVVCVSLQWYVQLTTYGRPLATPPPLRVTLPDCPTWPNPYCHTAKHNLELDQMDVSMAYLNGELEEDLYMLPPEGVPIQPGYCWKLQHSLYGLKQARRTWNKTLDCKLGELGLTRLDAETCLYVYQKDGQVCFLVVYVNDLLLAASSQKFMGSIKAKLSSVEL